MKPAAAGWGSARPGVAVLSVSAGAIALLAEIAARHGAIAVGQLDGALAVSAALLVTSLIMAVRHRKNGSAEHRNEPADHVDVLANLPGLVARADCHGTINQIAGLDGASVAAALDMRLGSGFADRIHVSDRLSFLSALDDVRQGALRRRLRLRLTRTRSAAAPATPQFMTLDCVLLNEGAGRILIQALPSETSQSVSGDASERGEAVQSDSDKTRFLAAVSHEMRTPLNAIIGFADLLLRDTVSSLPSAKKRNYIGLIHQSGEHLLALVNTMLDISKLEAGKYSLVGNEFDVAPVVEECRQMLSLEAQRKGVDLALRPLRQSGSVTADRRAVQQILINLIGNAIKFTDRGGVVTVDAAATGDMLRLTVSDTGIGMSAAMVERLGQPFVQADGSAVFRHEGTGLGLCLVQGLVGLHGGTMSIESEPSRGTAVTVDLPLNGSGIRPGDDNVLTVEFPPRLKQDENRHHIEHADDGKTTKTA